MTKKKTVEKKQYPIMGIDAMDMAKIEEMTKQFDPVRYTAEGPQVGVDKEKITSDDMLTPMMVIAQNTSKSVLDGSVAFGNFMDTVTGEDMGNQRVIIPLLLTKQRIKYVPIALGGGLECMSTDLVKGSVHGLCAQCPHAVPVSGQIWPACHTPIVIIFLDVRSREIYLAQGISTSVVAFKKVASLIDRGHFSACDFAWLMSTQEASQGTNKYFKFNFRQIQHTRAFAGDEMYENLKKQCAEYSKNAQEIIGKSTAKSTIDTVPVPAVPVSTAAIVQPVIHPLKQQPVQPVKAGAVVPPLPPKPVWNNIKGLWELAVQEQPADKTLVQQPGRIIQPSSLPGEQVIFKHSNGQQQQIQVPVQPAQVLPPAQIIQPIQIIPPLLPDQQPLPGNSLPDIPDF